MVRERVCWCQHVVVLLHTLFFYKTFYVIHCVIIIEPTFHVPTEAKEMTPEKFHDFLSLASSPPLHSSIPPHPLATHSESRQSDQEKGVSDGNGERCEQCGEAADVSSTPSFAQVSISQYS